MCMCECVNVYKKKLFLKTIFLLDTSTPRKPTCFIVGRVNMNIKYFMNKHLL